MGDQDCPAIENVSPGQLEARIRDVARRLSTEPLVGDLETWYLARVVEHCSRAISDVYRTVNLDQILRGDPAKRESLEDLQSAISGHPAGPLRKVARAPDELRGLGDRCLYDIGMAGFREYHGLSLETLGIRSYRMAADVLSILADERELRELFQRNLVRTLSIDEEIAFLRRCAARFHLYVQLLSSLRGEMASPGAVVLNRAGGMGGGGGVSGRECDAEPGASSRTFPGVPAAGGELDERERLLARCERMLLLAGTEMERVRRELSARLIGQPEVVETVCDDLLLQSAATRVGRVPPAYLLTGPRGVGKTHLLRSLAGILESQWHIEVPLLILEGAQCASPTDLQRLSGSAPDPSEEGVLEEFRRRARRAPLSVLVIREVEKAHPRLQRFFFPLLAERFLGRVPSSPERDFEGAILAFTLNSSRPSCEPPEAKGGWESSPRGNRHEQQEGERSPEEILSPGLEAGLQRIRFSPLSRASMERILDLEIDPVIRRFQTLHGLEVSLTPAARRLLLALGFNPHEGGRRLTEVVQRQFNLEIARTVKSDEGLQDIGREDAIRCLREIRREGHEFEPGGLEENLLRQVRARVPYRRILVDASDGRFSCRGET